MVIYALFHIPTFQPSPLFSKIEPAQAEEFKKRFAGKQQKVSNNIE